MVSVFATFSCWRGAGNSRSSLRTANFDVSDWVLGGFPGEIPELAEFVGAVEIRKSDLCGRGLFAKRNYLIVLASRDIKAGGEITFPYLDILTPVETRQAMSRNWGLGCSCRRCRFEEEMISKQELKELKTGLAIGMDPGSLVYRLEEYMRRWGVRGKEKGYLRASLWGAYSGMYGSGKIMRKWGRRVPTAEAVVDSVVEAAGGDERALKVSGEQVKRSGGGVVDMERVFKLGRGLYGKVVKRQALRALVDL